MKKINTIIVALFCSLCILPFKSLRCDADNEYVNSDFSEMLDDVVNQGGLTEVVDEAENDVTGEFLKWYENGKSDIAVFDYLAENNMSFLTITSNKDTKSARSFETISKRQLFVDSFSAKLIDDKTQIVRFTTTLSGTITYNANTYDVVNVFSPSISTQYTGDYPMFVSFYADGYSVSTSISSDKTYGYVTGSCNLYATLYPDNPVATSTKLLKRVVHTMSISA